MVAAAAPRLTRADRPNDTHFGTLRSPTRAHFANRLIAGRRSTGTSAPASRSGFVRPGTDRAPSYTRPVDEPPRGRRLAWSTAIFSLATGISRILGLVREVIAAAIFSAEGKINA